MSYQASGPKEEYKVVYAIKEDLTDAFFDLYLQVNELCKDGWEVTGGICFVKEGTVSYYAAQALVRKHY
jgi:hypothetical protein